jgi:small subunit ribosomal protein S1
MFKKGDMVKAVVLSIDKQNERFSLGIKQLEPDPWEDVPRKYRRGQMVKGTITNVTDFGIFLELEEGVEGLVHVSEAGEDKDKDLKEIGTVGDELDVLIISIDKRNRKIGLSLRELKQVRDEHDMQSYMDNQQENQHATLGDLLSAARSAKPVDIEADDVAAPESAAAPEPESTPAPETDEDSDTKTAE